jgi:hypothetical protein
MTKEHIDTTGSTVKIDGTTIDGITPGSIPFSKPSRDTKEVTTQKDTVRRYGLKLLDPGEASFQGIYIPNDAGQLALAAAAAGLAEHTIQIAITEASIIYEYQAFVSTFYLTEEDENTLMFNCDLRVTGGFTKATTSAAITSIEGAAAGIAYSPGTANTALAATANDVIFKEATGITTDTVEVTAAAASYIGISYDGGLTWKELTSGTPADFLAASWPAAAGLAKALIKVMETNKATRFVNLFIARA